MSGEFDGLSAIVTGGASGIGLATALALRDAGARVAVLDRTTDVPEGLVAFEADVDDVASMQYVDLHTWLTGDILAKADRMSMAHSLELRVPFLDQVVYAAAAGLPTEMKLPAGSRTTKHALREAMRGIVPESVRERRKLGFPTPTRLWLQGSIGEWVAGLIAGSGARRLLDLDYALRLLAEHRAGTADHSRKVWTVAIFCLWYAIFVDGTIRPAAPARTVPTDRWATVLTGR